MAEFTTALEGVLRSFRLPGASEEYFQHVLKGEPRTLVPHPVPQIVWKVQRTQEPPEGPRNVRGRRSVALVFSVMCFWPAVGDPDVVERQEDDIATVLIALPADIIALTPPGSATTYTVAGKTVNLVTVEDDTEAVFEPWRNSEIEMRQIGFEVHARILEAT